ncbi:probable CCR4-associated factor 1 homolog 11 [Phragmites australis]|uniref:probable CCR4-associated factor 1 homolog 11 n=1 Tax=Phragmites australis TaxID=29695 RepID=UPI002D784217|nr:probable CCR4-associated factor 1 homolog 11 [Phragmites australis]
MLFRDDGPSVVLPPPPPPPPQPQCGFVNLVPQHPMHMQFPPQAACVVLPRGAFLDAEVRDVWAANLQDELSHIAALLPHYPCVCVDTEFPGTVHDSRTPRHLRGPRESYALVKKNVDDLKLLQIGIALSGPSGRCPVAWQFNLRGFDAGRDPHAPASIAMLRAQGMDFATLQQFGVDPGAFASGFYQCGLACGGLTWAAFSGAYDFAYLAKVLGGGCPLPDTPEGFLAQVRALFGPAVLDVKRLARFCGEGIRGGLEQVAAALGVERAAGRAHCAGSDSLLTCDVLLAMVDRFFRDNNVLVHAGAIVGLV